MRQYDDAPYMQSPSRFQHPQHQQQQQPTVWCAYAQYHPGQAVWYGGTVWRCDVAHTSGAEPRGVPARNFHLWTPVSSYTNHGRGTASSSKTYPAPSKPYDRVFVDDDGEDDDASSHIISPRPLPMPARPPSPGLPKDDSPDSQGTITPDEKPAAGPSWQRAESSRGGFMDMNYFATKAAESLRYLTLKDEGHKAKDSEELRDELKGKRIWRAGGLGVWTYSLDPEVEGKKQDVWRDWARKNGRDEWRHAARARTEFYARDSRGAKPLFMWKLVERGGAFPHDALPIGSEDAGKVLYAARSWWESGIHLGKAGPHLINGSSISYGGGELNLDTFEVLCGPPDPELIKWMTFRHGERAMVEGWQPVEGGREADGTAIFLAKGEFESGEHPGKCSVNDDHACIGWGGGEVWVRPFQILAYCKSDRR